MKILYETPFGYAVEGSRGILEVLKSPIGIQTHYDGGAEATFEDMVGQINIILPQPGIVGNTVEHPVTFHGPIDPTHNIMIIPFIKQIHGLFGVRYLVRPVLETYLPRDNKYLKSLLRCYLFLQKSVYKGRADLIVTLGNRGMSAGEAAAFLFDLAPNGQISIFCNPNDRHYFPTNLYRMI